MAFMRRDVNLGLLFLIIAALLMFTGFTVYYQTTFRNVSKNYELKLAELDKITSELAAKRTQLNETSIQLQLRRQKEDDLSKQFTDVRGENEQLETDKKKLEQELLATKSQVASLTTDLANVKAQLDAEKIARAQKEQQLNRLIDDLRDEINCLQDEPDANEGNC